MKIYSSVAIVFLAQVVAADRRRRHHRLRHLNEDISMSMSTPMPSSLIGELLQKRILWVTCGKIRGYPIGGSVTVNFGQLLLDLSFVLIIII